MVWNTFTWDLQNLAAEWISDQDVKKELESSFKFESDNEAEIGLSF